MSTRLGRLATAVEEYLLAWIVLAVVLGAFVPRLAAITRASTPILAVMIGSVSLTLSVDRFRAIDGRALALVLLGHVTMPALAFGVARALALPAPVVVGFVVLGAVTPELVTPVMTELAGGDTALSTTALVVTGLGSLAFVPLSVTLLVGDVDVPAARIVEGLVAAVVAPMLVAVGARAWRPEVVGRYDDYYPAVSAAMVVLIIGGVTAANAAVIRTDGALLLAVVAAAATLNGLGYGVGFLAGRWGTRRTRIAATLSVGMRDFAVAAALVVAANLPTIASLPAVAFGVVEMITSAALARAFSAGGD